MATKLTNVEPAGEKTSVDVEMESLRAVAAALKVVDKDARERILRWATSFYGVYLG